MTRRGRQRTSAANGNAAAARLFHTTHMAAATAIMESQRFRLGKKTGFAGSAVYFAASRDEAVRRCRGGKLSPDVIFECDVVLGRVLHAERWAQSMDSCRAAGFECVQINGQDVYAIYNPDCITISSCKCVHTGQEILSSTSKPGEATATTSFTIEWNDQQVGLGLATHHQIVKVPSKDYVQRGDVVKATRDLHYPTFSKCAFITKGSLGVLKSINDPYEILWSDFSFDATVPKDDVVKCEPHEFVREGDMVETKNAFTHSTGDAAGKRVKHGSLGILRSNPVNGQASIEWEGRQLGVTTVFMRQITKVSSDRFLRVGDVVKAAYDLNYQDIDQGHQVKCGALGILKSGGAEDDLEALQVSWWGHDLAVTSALKSQVIKAHPREYIIAGDVVQASYDLVYPCGKIKQGAFGVVKQAPAK